MRSKSPDPSDRPPGTFLPAEPGTYALLLKLPCPVSLKVGRLGELDFSAGTYLYLGSARGPGGIRARVERHLRTANSLSRHWHLGLVAAGD